jgi:hypothetical protein
MPFDYVSKLNLVFIFKVGEVGVRNGAIQVLELFHLLPQLEDSLYLQRRIERTS